MRVRRMPVRFFCAVFALLYVKGVIPPTLMQMSATTITLSGSAVLSTQGTQPLSQFTPNTVMLTPLSYSDTGHAYFVDPMSTGGNGFTVTYDVFLATDSGAPNTPPADGISCTVHGQASARPSVTSGYGAAKSTSSLWDTFSGSSVNTGVLGRGQVWSWDISLNDVWPTGGNQIRSWTNAPFNNIPVSNGPVALNFPCELSLTTTHTFYCSSFQLRSPTTRRRELSRRPSRNIGGLRFLPSPTPSRPSVT
jgi:hypothetical protein